MERLALSASMLAAVILPGLCDNTLAQEYPTKTIRVIVPYVPGGGTDIAARVIGHKLTERWGQQIVVENRGGAGGNIGTELASRAAPDGYTYLINSAGPMVINPSLFAKLPFDPVKDFAPVALLAPTYYLLITHPSVPTKSVRELIALAKQRPDRLVLASPGIGTPPDLTGEMFKNLADIKAVSVLYKGTGQALAEVVAGQASFMFCDVIAAISFVKSGRVKPLAVATPKRIGQFPEVPTLAEAGVPWDALGWTALFLPAGAPAPIIRKLSSEVRSILKLPDVQERLGNDGSDFGENTPEYLAAYVKSETAKWAKVVKVSGRRVE